MKKDSVMAWGSFISYFAWYHVIFYNFTNSPLSVLASRATAANPQTLLTLFLIFDGAALLISFLILKDKDMHTIRPFWYSIHIAIFICAAVIPFVTNLSLMYLFAILCGGLSGIIFYRILYTSFFYAPKIGWTRMLIAALFIFNVLIHLYALAPDDLNPVPMYAVSLILLCISLIMSLAYKGNTLEIRKSLPENKLTLRSILPVLALLTGVATCFSAYRSVVLTFMPETYDIAVHQAVVCAVSLIVLFVVGNKLGQSAYLIIFLALLTATFISFQLLGTDGHKVAETFIQPAYICWNILLLSYLRSLFYKYGKNHLRLRFVMVIFLMAIILPETAARWFFKEFFAGGLQRFELLYIVVFGLVLLIPQIRRTITVSFQEKPEDETSGDSAAQNIISDALAELLTLLSPSEQLTARETDILKLLLERQDTDVIAYMLGTSINTVRIHTKQICEKFGIRSKTELISEHSSMMDELLSPDEKNVAMLLIEGETQRQISRKLHLSSSEFNQQMQTIRDKIGVQRDPVIDAIVKKYALTGRETNMLTCLRGGMTNSAIADELFLSELTVKNHVRSLMNKLPVESRREIPVWVESFAEKTE